MLFFRITLTVVDKHQVLKYLSLCYRIYITKADNVPYPQWGQSKCFVDMLFVYLNITNAESFEYDKNVEQAHSNIYEAGG